MDVFFAKLPLAQVPSVQGEVGIQGTEGLSPTCRKTF